MANDPKYQDLLTDLDEDGERVSFALQPQRTPEDLFRLREIVKLWARVCFGKPTGAKFVAKDGLNAVTVVVPARGQEVRHQLRGQRRGVPPAPAEERPGLRHGSHRHQGRPQPASVRAGAAQGLLRAHRGGAAGRHHRERRQDAHQPGPGLQRGAHRPLPRHAGGRRRLRRRLRHQPERARHHHDLRPAGDPRGRDAVRQPDLRRRLHQRRDHHLRQRVHPERAHLPQGGVGVRRRSGLHVRQLPPPERRDLQGDGAGALHRRRQPDGRVQRHRQEAPRAREAHLAGHVHGGRRDPRQGGRGALRRTRTTWSIRTR